MRFDSSAKNYHFPSASSITDMDARFYFPDHSKFSKDATEIEVNTTAFTKENSSSIFTSSYE